MWDFILGLQLCCAPCSHENQPPGPASSEWLIIQWKEAPSSRLPPGLLVALVESIGAVAVAEVGVPHPLHQEPPAAAAVHVVPGSVLAVHRHLPRVGAAAARAVDALAQVRYLRRERGVGPRVPGVHQRVRRQLRQLVAYHAHHPVHADVPVGRRRRLPLPLPRRQEVLRDGEGVRADARAARGGVAHPRVREGVADDGGEGKVVEAAGPRAEVLHGDVGGGEEEVEPAAGVHRKRATRGGDGGADDVLDGEAGEGAAVGVMAVVLFRAEGDAGGDVGAGLVGVEAHGAPPPGDGGVGGGVVGDGPDEAPQYVLLPARPGPIPDDVNGGVGGRRRRRPPVCRRRRG